MTWTTMRPHRAGHYWYFNQYMAPDIVWVAFDKEPAYVCYLGADHTDSLDQCMKAKGAMWSGPIPEPGGSNIPTGRPKRHLPS